MSNNVNKIKKSLNEKGYILVKTEWEPLGKNIEMMGREGGWVIYYKEPDEDFDDIIVGYNVEEVLASIDELAYLCVNKT